MSRKSTEYKHHHQVFGDLEVTLRVEGSDDKSNKSSLTFKNLGGCYPFVVRTEAYEECEKKWVEIEFDGSGEETSLLICLAKIVDKARKDGIIPRR